MSLSFIYLQFLLYCEECRDVKNILFYNYDLSLLNALKCNTKSILSGKLSASIPTDTQWAMCTFF